MNLLCLTYGDGSNRTFEKLMSTLRQRGANVQIVAWDRSAKFERHTIHNGFRYYYLMRGWGEKNRKLIMARPLWMFRLFLYLLRQRPTILWAANFDTAFPTALATIFTKVPFVYYIHDNISISYTLPSSLRYLLENVDSWIIKRAATVIVPDENRILSHANKYRSKFHILPNTPDASIAPTEGAPAGSTFTVYVTGSLWNTRGVETLLRATDQLMDCRVLVAGKVPQPEILEMLRSRPYVDFRGSVSHQEALSLYHEADLVFAFYDPKISINVRASPTKLYEAMMMGRAVLVNEETEISSKVRSWNIGYLCKYHDAKALAELLTYAQRHRDEVAQKGQRGHELFKAQFDWRLLEPHLWNIVQAVVPPDLSASPMPPS